MNKIHYSHESSSDLDDIKRHITEELNSPIAAKNTIAKILRKIRLLEKHAELGAPLSPKVNFETNYRFLVSGSYLIFYRTDEADIFVIRIIYGGRDYISILFGDLESDYQQ